ncbi:MAG: hypothetical protein CL677_09135 [Bdellovibrionaceae bacterium]|nr:hypothetical protein [Pseudobdellovibrionaceae bacterium]|tara:strand:+ start:34133 stop:34564 length:432 start_codon:yes stop_codon:yes gene_type:complete
MTLSKYILIILVQIIAVPVAIFSFKLIEIRFFASAVASMYFILSTSLVLAICFKFQPRVTRSPVFWSSWGFLILFALPIFLGRMIYPPNIPFSEISILGVPGSVMHSASSYFFSFMVLMTGLEMVLLFLNKGTKKALEESSEG